MNKLRTQLLLVACGVMTLFPATAAWADDVGAYLRLDGGGNFAEDPTLDIDGAPGKLRLDAGFRADLAVGYNLNRWVGLEFEGGFFHNSAESLTLGNQSPHLDDTWLQGVPFLAKVIFRYENRTAFVPFISAGAGGVVSILSINSDTDTTSAFAFQLGAGVIYKLEERAWLEFGYKYLAVGDSDFDIAGTSVKASDLRNHFIGAGVTWEF